MQDDTQTTENGTKSEEDRLMAKSGWNVLFFVGYVGFVFVVIGTAEQMFNNTWGLQRDWMDVLSFIAPLFIGVPAILFAIGYDLAFRLNRVPVSVMLLLAYILLVGTVLVFLTINGWVFSMIAGSSLAGILFIPLCIGIPATVLSIKSALVRRPSRLHISMMLLLAYVLLFALNFVEGAAACC